MQFIRNAIELRSLLGQERLLGKRVALVPTMGYLHAGHLSLIDRAHQVADVVVVSVFVNPLQFNEPKDFELYPVDSRHDRAQLLKSKAAVVFSPDLGEMYDVDTVTGYARRPRTSIAVASLSERHEGEFRPGHFDGVVLVVTILFNLVRPDVAVFGEKDFQQLRIIEQLVSDLRMGIEIVRAPLVRESDGLALSSRNVRLSERGRQEALRLSRGLHNARQLWEGGEVKAELLSNCIRQELEASTLIRTQYVRVVDEQNLEEIPIVQGHARALVAAFVEDVRLIDTIPLYRSQY